MFCHYLTQVGYEVESGGVYEHEKLEISDWARLILTKTRRTRTRTVKTSSMMRERLGQRRKRMKVENV